MIKLIRLLLYFLLLSSSLLCYSLINLCTTFFLVAHNVFYIGFNLTLNFNLFVRQIFLVNQKRNEKYPKKKESISNKLNRHSTHTKHFCDQLFSSLSLFFFLFARLSFLSFLHFILYVALLLLLLLATIAITVAAASSFSYSVFVRSSFFMCVLTKLSHHRKKSMNVTTYQYHTI